MESSTRRCLSRTWQAHRLAWRSSSNSISWRCATLVVKTLSFHLLKMRCGSCWQICHLQDIICLGLGDHVYIYLYIYIYLVFHTYMRIYASCFIHAQNLVYYDMIVTTFGVKPCDTSSMGFWNPGRSRSNNFIQDWRKLLQLDPQTIWRC